jgi:hypothetical protein
VEQHLFSIQDYQMALSFVPVMMLLGGLLGFIWYINHKKNSA